MIAVTIDSSSLHRLRRQIAAGKGRGQEELRRGLNQAGAKTLTQVRRALKTQTGVKKYATIVGGTTPIKAGSNLTFVIRAKGKGLPIRDFPARLLLRQGISAAPWAAGRVFARSFSIGKSRDPGAFRARVSDARFPIRTLRGPSLPKELTVDQSAAAFWSTVEAEVPRILATRLARVFG